MKARTDRGYLYFALIANGRDIPMDDVYQWLEKALPASGLPSPAEGIVSDLRVIGSDALDGPARHRLDEVFALRRGYYEAALGRGEVSVQDLDGVIPPVLIQGNKFITFKGQPRQGTLGDPGAWLEGSLSCFMLIREFVDACVV